MAAAILLAAGESTRMGRPKALLPWRDATLIDYQARELAAARVALARFEAYWQST